VSSISVGEGTISLPSVGDGDGDEEEEEEEDDDDDDEDGDGERTENETNSFTPRFRTAKPSLHLNLEMVRFGKASMLSSFGSVVRFGPHC
jgi:hypothetical protein